MTREWATGRYKLPYVAQSNCLVDKTLRPYTIYCSLSNFYSVTSDWMRHNTTAKQTNLVRLRIKTFCIFWALENNMEQNTSAVYEKSCTSPNQGLLFPLSSEWGIMSTKGCTWTSWAIPNEMLAKLKRSDRYPSWETGDTLWENKMAAIWKTAESWDIRYKYILSVKNKWKVAVGNAIRYPFFKFCETEDWCTWLQWHRQMELELSNRSCIHWIWEVPQVYYLSQFQHWREKMTNKCYRTLEFWPWQIGFAKRFSGLFKSFLKPGHCADFEDSTTLFIKTKQSMGKPVNRFLWYPHVQPSFTPAFTAQKRNAT